jgi:hypothetical protein
MSTMVLPVPCSLPGSSHLSDAQALLAGPFKGFDGAPAIGSPFGCAACAKPAFGGFGGGSAFESSSPASLWGAAASKLSLFGMVVAARLWNLRCFLLCYCVLMAQLMAGGSFPL